MAIILASASPRRKELLEMLEVKDLTIFPAVGPEVTPENALPGEIVEALSKSKAKEVFDLCERAKQRGACVLAADTIVWNEGRALGKPQNREEAAEMLRALSGKTHQVYTGVTVCKGDICISEHEVTSVTFRALNEEEIAAYVESGEPMDKAGAYGIQGKGSLFVQGIKGDYFNVVGLPLCRVGIMLKTIGVQLI